MNLLRKLFGRMFRKKDAKPAPTESEILAVEIKMTGLERRMHLLANGMLHRSDMIRRSKDAEERIEEGYDIPGDNNRASEGYRQIAQEEYDEMRAEYEELERRMGELKRERETLL